MANKKNNPNDFQNVKVIGFDADDTLWVNETYFREAEDMFEELMEPYTSNQNINKELLKVEIENLKIYGYGIKGFVLSMIETAHLLSNGKVDNITIQQLIQIGKDMLNKPVELLDGVEETLSKLSQKFKLILATKGDLLDQERKLKLSGLNKYFHHIEVMPDKLPSNFSELLAHLDIQASEFVMIGNSVKSDILPVLEIGSQAIHVPFHTTWEHEEVKSKQLDLNFRTCEKLEEAVRFL